MLLTYIFLLPIVYPSMERMTSEPLKVCVTGGAGYLASFLIKQLLQRGHTVHATLRSLADASKVALLETLDHPHHPRRLYLFEADIYNPHDNQFAEAIQGCQVVVHMATPLQHYTHSSQYKNTSEAAVAGVRIIMKTCLRSNTVKKLIYTASVVSASPLKEDGPPGTYKDSMDETCWTPLDRAYHVLTDYVHSKTISEKQVLSYNSNNNGDEGGIQVVSLACGLVGGDTIQSRVAESMEVLLSQATNDEARYETLRILEEMLRKVPIAHIHDVTRAHIFSMENPHPHMNGRFLCASDFLTSAEIASLILETQQGSIIIPPGFIEDTKREIKWGSRKLEDLGFRYECDAEKIIRDSLVCAKRLGRIV